MTKFVDAVNSNGVKQSIPADWLDPACPFAAQFRLAPSARDALEDSATAETDAAETDAAE